MNELQYVREKFKGRDLIEITADTQIKMINWMTGKTGGDGQDDLRKVCQRLSERGFIKFLNKGVIVIKHKGPNENIRNYPFEFTDFGTLKLSVYVSNPFSTNPYNTSEILCKVECDTNTKYTVLEGTYNQKLAIDHIANEFENQRLGISQMLPIIQSVSKEFPDLEPDTEAWRIKVSEEYFRSVIKTQIISTIATNAYLSLLDKEILITRITQDRVMKASDRKEAKKSKRTPFYRYVVDLPENYTPRKFNLNYLVSEWERSGHMATRWVREENAQIIAERSKGRVVGRKRGEYVAVLVPISPQTCKRKVVKLDKNPGSKTYE
jgi:hypothetical protein